MKDTKDLKAFNIRLEPALHKFLKMYCVENETDMNAVLTECIKKLRNKNEKILTHQNANV